MLPVAEDFGKYTLKTIARKKRILSSALDSQPGFMWHKTNQPTNQPTREFSVYHQKLTHL